MDRVWAVALSAFLAMSCGGDADGPVLTPEPTESITATPTATPNATVTPDVTPTLTPTAASTPIHGGHCGEGVCATQSPSPTPGPTPMMYSHSPTPTAPIPVSTPTAELTSGTALIYYYLNGSFLGQEEGLSGWYDDIYDELTLNLPHGERAVLSLEDYTWKQPDTFSCADFGQSMGFVLQLPDEGGGVQMPGPWAGQRYIDCRATDTIDEMDVSMRLDKVGDIFDGHISVTIEGSGSRSGEVFTALIGFEGQVGNMPDIPEATPTRAEWSVSKAFHDGHLIGSSETSNISWSTDALVLRLGEQYQHGIELPKDEVLAGSYHCDNFSKGHPSVYMHSSAESAAHYLCASELSGTLKLDEVDDFISGVLITVGQGDYSGLGGEHSLLVETVFSLRVPPLP